MPETKTKPKAKAEPDNDDLIVLRCEAAGAAIAEACRDNVTYLESGERQAPKSLFDSIQALIEICAEGPSIPWPQKSWEFLEHVASLAKLIENDKASWRANSPQFFRRLQFFLQRAIDQTENLLDSTPPEDVAVDLESIGELVEQKLNDDQIARVYGWYTPSGQPDRKRVKNAKKGKEKTPETVTHKADFGGPQRQPHLADLDSCLSLFDSQ